MNYVISYVVLFQVISSFGLDSIEIREISKGEVPYQVVIGTSFIIRLVLSCFFIFLAIFTSWQIGEDVFTTLLVIIYSLSIPLNCFMVIRNYFTAIVQNEYVVKVEIGRTVIGMLLKLILLWFDSTLVWFVCVSMFDFMLTASGYIAAYRAKVGNLKDWQFDGQCARFLLKESWPLLLTNAAVILYQRIDQVMVGQFIDDDKQSVGFFSVASRFVEVLIYIPMILSQTIMPVLVKEKKRGQAYYERNSQRFMNVSVWLSLVASFGTSFVAYWLILLLFGEAYLPAVAILQVMSFKAASVALSNSAGAMLVAEGLQRYAFYRDILGCFVCIALNCIFLPRYGVIAAAYITIASNVTAGFLADAIIPAYRHLFVRQCKAIAYGWIELGNIRQLIKF